MSETEVTLLPKMSIKTMGANGAIVHVTKTKTPVIRVYGVARNIKSATGSNGDPVFGLVGQFEGINIADKTTYQSSVLYLPNGIQELIMDPLEVILNGDDKLAKAQGVQFALDIFAVPDGNKAGYTFNAAFASDVGRADPLEAMRKSLKSAALPALPKTA